MTLTPNTNSYFQGRNFSETLSKGQVKELCFIIHNGKTEKERNNAKFNLANSFKGKIEMFCKRKMKDIYGEDINFYREDIKNELKTFKEICFDVLYEYTSKYDPEHSSGANLFTYASKEINHRLLLETNKGMTETEIRNFNKIYNAKKYYEEKYDTTFNETESQINELSKICGLSVKVIKKILKLKRELTDVSRPVFFSTVINENEDGEITYEDRYGDMTYSPERQFAIKSLRKYLSSLSKEDNAILYTMVDKDYNTISEREGVRLLANKGFDIGRGTLNRKREELKKKLEDFYYGCAA